MSQAAGISVIVCTWNRAETLKATLCALEAQSLNAPVDVEVIVVDNNSTDGTRDAVESMRPAWRLGRLFYVFEPRQGKQFALNAGIAQARMELLAFTDDDILVAADWITAILRNFENPAIELAGGKTLVVWPPTGRPRWYHPGMAAVVGEVDVGTVPMFPAPRDFVPAGANLVARRSLFDRVGRFSEAHFRHMDFEFGMRCAHAGAGIAYLPALQVHAPVDAAILSKRYFRRWSFKAGIARDAEPVDDMPQMLQVPRWLLRQAMEDFLWLLLRGFSTGNPESFSRDLRMRRALGTIVSRWYAILFPGRHERWIERYSQKRKNLY